MKLVSVIVPVYNCDNFLSRCLNSIINQDYTNLEIILINDGSTDSSEKICQEYAQTDKRIKVINKENGGVSAARNTGLKEAQGDYIAFVDSDDYVEKTFISQLLEKSLQTDAEMAFCRIKRFNSNGEYFYPNEINLTQILEKNIAPFFYTTNYSDIITKIEGVIWRTLYKAEFLENEYFNENVRYGEDLIFIASLILKSKKIVIVDEYLYNYFTNVNSACNLINERYFTNLKDYYIATIDFLNKNDKQELKYLVDYGFLVRYVQNKIHNKNFVKEMKALVKTDSILQGCLNKDSYKRIKKHETKKSVKIRNFLIYHKMWTILKIIELIR